MAVQLTPALAGEYQQLFDSCIITASKYSTVDSLLDRMMTGKDRYVTVGDPLGIPWYFIGILHCLEAGFNFNTHLHNGDPLTARTVHVPKGRPLVGDPPFTWEESATDALTMEGFVGQQQWGVPNMLYDFERYNGFGYRARGINSPYLWAGSQHYTAGKFTADGVFDPNAVSTQIGAAVLLRRIYERQWVQSQTDVVSQVKALGAQVPFDPNTYNDQALQLQSLLNTLGMNLREDGYAGNRTSGAYQHVTGSYLQGDPRSNS
ncbi:hypothetical protein [Chitinophaga vietnamensis]|uniref:hypothetical protein n=1 Tax=Chitinophaga vietnamensis TaxID=2593957 RepID=UPI00191C56A0|nr:hypothetical protein [Chitinophaga vietnamensis]